MAVSPTKVSHKAHAKATVTLTIAGASHRPTGSVKIYDGSKLWVIDWEAAFLNDRYVDLAIVGRAHLVVGPDHQAGSLAGEEGPQRLAMPLEMRQHIDGDLPDREFTGHESWPPWRVVGA